MIAGGSERDIATIRLAAASPEAVECAARRVAAVQAGWWDACEAEPFLIVTPLGLGRREQIARMLADLGIRAARRATIADWARRSAKSISPRPVAAWAWVSRDSTVTGGSGALTGTGALAGALAGAALARFAARNRAAKEATKAEIVAGIARRIMGWTIRHIGSFEPCAK